VLVVGAEAPGEDAPYCRFATSREHADRRALKKARCFSGWRVWHPGARTTIRTLKV
jgi:hypothetical protein